MLFVSHNMATIQNLCQRVIWLVNGQVDLEGDAEQIISKYLTSSADHSGEIILNQEYKKKGFWFRKVFVVNVKGNVSSVFDVRESIKICLEYELKQNIRGLEIAFSIVNAWGVKLFTIERSFHLAYQLSPGIYIGEVDIPGHFLAPGSYFINVASYLTNVEILSFHQSIVSFKIEETGSCMAIYKGQNIGVVLVDFPWKELSINKT